MTYIATGLVEIMAMAVLCSMAAGSDILNAALKKRMMLPMLSAIAVIAAEIGTSALEYSSSGAYAADAALNVLGFALSPFIPIFIAAAFCNDTYTPAKLLFIFPAVNAVLAVMSPWAGFIFSVEEGAQYQRGPFFAVYVAAYASGLLLLLIETLRAVRRSQSGNSAALLLLFAFIFVGTSIQIAAPEIHTTWLCVCLAMTIYYAYFSEMSDKQDPLTGLFNRRAYESGAARLEGERRAAIIMFDVDEFKKINDNYGHQYGDECLKIIAGNIRAAYSKVGACYRTGGDEFCVIGLRADAGAVSAAAEKFVKLTEKSRLRDRRLPMVSLGSALYVRGGGTVEEAVGEADREMYAYKNRRKAALRCGGTDDSLKK
jgi:diguanylate cyclase (GGDEF)-like protein